MRVVGRDDDDVSCVYGGGDGCQCVLTECAVLNLMYHTAVCNMSVA